METNEILPKANFVESEHVRQVKTDNIISDSKIDSRDRPNKIKALKYYEQMASASTESKPREAELNLEGHPAVEADKQATETKPEPKVETKVEAKVEPKILDQPKVDLKSEANPQVADIQELIGKISDLEKRLVEKESANADNPKVAESSSAVIDDSNRIFLDPEGVVNEKVAAKLKPIEERFKKWEAVETQRAESERSKQFWDGFYKTRPELELHRKLVQRVLRENAETWKDLKPEVGSEKLASAVKAEIEEFKQVLSKEIVEVKPSIVQLGASGSETVNKSDAPKVEPKTDLASQIKLIKGSKKARF
jgi:hypothetical protein